MISKSTSFRTSLTVVAILLVGIAVFFNRTLASLGMGRFDLTDDKIYTISEGAKNIMRSLEVPVQIKYYVTPENEMPSGLKTLQQEVTDKLAELSIASRNMLEYTLVNPKETEELEEKLIQKGIRPFQVQSVDRDAMAVKLVYSAISIGYKDEPEEVLPQILPDNMGTFEYELLSAITKLIRDKDPVVAVYSTKEPLDPEMARFYIQAGQPMPPPTDNFASVSEFLRQEKYDVRAIELAKDNSIPSEANTVLVLGPRDLNERQRYEICQVLRRGGSVVVAAQATLYDYNPGPRGGYQISVRPQSLGINDLLSEFAVRIDDRLLMDTQMATLAIPSRRSFLGMSINVSEPVQAPMQIRVMGETINRDLPFTAGVPELLYLWGNQVIVDDAGVKEKNLKTTILLSGGPSSWTVDKKAGSLQQTDIVPEGHPVVANPTLAVLVEGVFPDPWEGKAAPEWPVSDSDAEEGASQDDHAHAEDAASQEAEVGAAGAPQPGRLLVIGCSKLFEDMLLDQAGHALFLLNSVDALTLGEDLISIRSKRYSQRTFAEVSDGKKLAFRVANIALVPVLVTVLGLGNRIRRRREAEEYASKFARAHGGNA